MRKDAEAHADEDKKKRELAEARNQAEALCFQTEKLIKEHDEKLAAADKAPLEAAIAKVREVAKGKTSMRSSQPTTRSSRLPTASRRSCTSRRPQRWKRHAEPAGSAAGKGGDDTIDAEFEVKKDG